jgi:hypothetical protein
MQVEIIDPSKGKRWDEFVANHPQGTAFHLSNWARVLQKTYGYIPHYLTLEDSDKKIKAGCPFFLIKSWLTGDRLVCLPFTDVCYPLVTSGEDVKFLFSTVVEKAKREKVDYIEVRGEYPDVSLQSLHFENHSYYKLFKLDLSQGINSIWEGFDKSNRKQIGRAERANLRIEKSETEKDMKDFYLLNLATRRKHGVLSQPYDFFENIWQELILKGLGFVLLVKYQKLPIAGGVFFAYKDTVYYKFNASDRNYLQYHPNHLLQWQAIKYSRQNGYNYLDSGRAAPDNPGLIRFKSRWGMQGIDLPYYYWPTVKGVTCTEQKSLKYRMVTSVMRRTPTAISKTAGKLFYKHLG